MAPGLSFTAVYTVLRRATAACHVKHFLSVQHVYFRWLLKQPCYTEPDLCWLLFCSLKNWKWRRTCLFFLWEPCLFTSEVKATPAFTSGVLPRRVGACATDARMTTGNGSVSVLREDGCGNFTLPWTWNRAKLLCLITPSMHPKHWAQNICTSHKEKLCSLLGNLDFLYRPEEQ